MNIFQRQIEPTPITDTMTETAKVLGITMQEAPTLLDSARLHLEIAKRLVALEKAMAAK